MPTFKKGDSVRQIAPAIAGVVQGFQVDQESGDRLILVEYTNAEGEITDRYFKESEIELENHTSEKETSVAETAKADEQVSPSTGNPEQGAASAK